MRDIFLFFAWIIGWLLFKNVEFLKSGMVEDRRFDISVIIPARNEEHNIGKILKTLERQSYKPREIIIVNDNSTDNTELVAASYKNVKVVSLRKEPPSGWIGKPWACWNGYLNSTGDLLLFLDADVELSETALESILKEYIRRGGLVSVWPYQRFERFYEHFTLPFNLIAVCSTDSFSLKGKSMPIGAFGPVLLTSRKDYEDVGGHQSVKDEIIEDLKLGRFYLEKGKNLTNLLGGELIRFRMYPKGVRQLFEGLTKNMASGAIHTGFLNFLLIFLWFTGIYSSFGSFRFNLSYLAYYLLFALQIYILTEKTGDYNIVDAVIYPVYFLFFLLIFVISTVRTIIFKSVVWKGRRIDV
ncbi:MAG: glycosyltransferase family 2 protein [bacterium]|nr:glycosyltransferase family 2 protein [bacterium]